MEPVDARVRPEFPTFCARDARSYSVHADLFEVVGQNSGTLWGERNSRIYLFDATDGRAAFVVSERDIFDRLTAGKPTRAFTGAVGDVLFVDRRSRRNFVREHRFHHIIPRVRITLVYRFGRALVRELAVRIGISPVFQCAVDVRRIRGSFHCVYLFQKENSRGGIPGRFDVIRDAYPARPTSF